MAKISLDIASLKSAGVYTFEYDNSIRSTTVDATTLRLLVGFNPKGPFNRPVLITSDSNREKLFGPIDTKLEHKGCFFNRFAQTLLAKGPFLALNLLKTDESETGPDQVNFASMSLCAGQPNPEVISAGKYGEYDYLNSLDASIYGDKSNYIPYIGKTPFASLFDRSRFWEVSDHNLTAVAANKLQTGDTTSFEHTNFLNFSNVGTDEISILVFKPENLSGYNITAAEWYNGAENIPYGWIRPSDYIADYFLTVICVKGNWSNSPALNTDPIWYSYFDKYGLLKSKINSFCGAEGVSLLGIWTGCIIPDFVDKQGNSQALLQKVNNNTEVTGLLMALNEDALQVLNYDYNGSADEDEIGSGCWFYDIDGDNQMSTDQGESSVSSFTVDMVGHSFKDGIRTDESANASVGLDSSFILYTDTINSSLYYLPNYDDVVTNSGNSNGLLNGTITTQESEFALDCSAYVAESDWFTIINSGDDSSEGGVDEGLYVSGKYISKDAKSTQLNLKLYSSTSADNKPVIKITAEPSKEVYVEDGELYTMLNNLEVKVKGIKDKKEDVDLKTSVSEEGSSLNFNSETKTAEIIVDKTYAELKNDDISSIRVTVSLKDTIKNPNIESDSKAEIDKLIGDGRDKTTYITSINKVGDSNSFSAVVLTIESNNVSASTNVPYGTYLGVSGEGSSYDYTLYNYGVKTRGKGTAFKETIEPVNTKIVVEEEKFPAFGNELTFVYPISGTKKVRYTLKNVYPSNAKDNKYTGTAIALNSGKDNKIYGINFLSYNFVANETTKNDVIYDVNFVELFNDASIFASENDSAPVSETTFNIFAITDKNEAEKLVVGDYVHNIAIDNKPGEAQETNTIPGITRVTSKVFVNVDSTNTFTYKGASYSYKGKNLIVDVNYGVRGFYLFTTIDGIKVNKETNLNYAFYKEIPADSVEKVSDYALTPDTKLYPYTNADDTVKGYETESGIDVLHLKDGYTFKYTTAKSLTKQLPISDNVISRSLRFIPLKGLKITGRHRPGYDENGNIDIEGGIEKVYSMLEDEGILRGLCNAEMADFRYIVDSMSYGVKNELGGKVHLSRVAKAKGKCLAILNMPSVRQFTNSQNPYFCDTYVNGSNIKPAFNTKYIPQGGNQELYATNVFSLPSEDNGSKFSAAFFPHLKYSYNNKTILVPPAADVANTLVNKFTSGDPYMICANLNGILNNPSITGVEYNADQKDRDYLEPFGVNTIITRNDNVMVYGNQTCYQTVKSDLNKLHIRENLNTIEIAVDNALKDFVFEYNNATTRATIVSKITPYFNNMQLSGAIESYNIVCDETNNTADIIEEDILIVDTEVQFTHGAEKIVHRITVNRVGSTSD